MDNEKGYTPKKLQFFKINPDGSKSDPVDIDSSKRIEFASKESDSVISIRLDKPLTFEAKLKSIKFRLPHYRHN